MIKTLHLFEAAFVVAAVLMPSGASAAAELLYGNNLDTGAIRSFSPTTSATATYSLSTAVSVVGLAANDAAQRLYVSTTSTGGSAASPANNLFTYDYNGNLLSMNRIALASGTSFAPTGLTYANGTLYATKAFSTSGRSGIYAINPTTGLTTLAGALSDADPPAAPTVNANPLDIDYDAVNNRFISTNGIVSLPASARGLYAITLPTVPGGMASTTFLAAPPPTQPTGASQPDGIAISGNIAYLTYNRSGVIARFDLTTNTYLSNLAGVSQSDGGSGDATFATGFVGVVPEPVTLALAPLLAVGLRRRRNG